MRRLTLVIFLVLTFAATVSADTPVKTPPRIEIAVTKRGFNPDTIAVPAKQPVTLVFTRKTDATCTRRVVLTMDDGKKVERELPLDKPVELVATFPRAGKLSYACSMDMVKGVIVVE